MKEMKNPELYDISIEEFDEINGEHIFSQKYTQRKNEMLKNYRKGFFKRKCMAAVKVAAVFALVAVSGSVITNAATNGILFSRIWGSDGKKNIEAHDEVVYFDNADSPYTVAYPKREYEEMNEIKAEELIGGQISYPSVTKEIAGTTITILAAVSDGNSAVVEYTMEKEGGVDVLNYSQLTNESKGAWFSESSTFCFWFSNGGGSTFVDLDKSTDDKVYCYEYMTLDNPSNKLSMEIYEFPCTMAEMDELSEEKKQKMDAETKKYSVDIPVKDRVEVRKYVNPDGGVVEISPLSIAIDMKTGLGLKKKEECDPYNCYYVAIKYKDGTDYVVAEHERAGKHDCEVEIDNSGYACGNLEHEMTYVFNRLVDINNIESITVNETEYVLE